MAFLRDMSFSDGPTVTYTSPLEELQQCYILFAIIRDSYRIDHISFYALSMASLGVLDLFNVKGRVAVVTGGSSGLGLMICKVGSHHDLF